MDFLKQNKILTAGGAIVLLVVFYYAFFSSSSDPAPLLEENAQGVGDEAAELLAALSGLQTIKLDNSIFVDPKEPAQRVFRSLTDFGVDIPKQNVGRRNPFLPLFSTEAPPRGGTLLAPGL